MQIPQSASFQPAIFLPQPLKIPQGSLVCSSTSHSYVYSRVLNDRWTVLFLLKKKKKCDEKVSHHRFVHQWMCKHVFRRGHYDSDCYCPFVMNIEDEYIYIYTHSSIAFATPSPSGYNKSCIFRTSNQRSGKYCHPLFLSIQSFYVGGIVVTALGYTLYCNS